MAEYTSMVIGAVTGDDPLYMQMRTGGTVYAQDYAGTTAEQQISAAIADAVSRGYVFCFVPQNMIPYNLGAITTDPSVRIVDEGDLSTPEGPLTARNTVQIVTASLAAGGIENGTVSPGSRTALLLKITADKPCRVVFYSTAAARTADATRPRSSDPPPGQGILGEFIFSVASTIDVAPSVFLYNGDASANTVYYKVENDGASAQVITLDLLHLDMEAEV